MSIPKGHEWHVEREGEDQSILDWFAVIRYVGGEDYEEYDDSFSTREIAEQRAKELNDDWQPYDHGIDRERQAESDAALYEDDWGHR